MTEELVGERHEHVLLLRINRPEARNALNTAVMRALTGAIAEAESDPDVRAVVITGTGDRSFCAGMDLKEFAAGDAQDPEVMRRFTRMLDGEVGIPLVGAANASAYGGGLEILLACDVIVASSEAKFGLPEVSRGLFPGGNGTAIARRVPLGVALEMTLTGAPITATRGHEVGLLNAVVAPDQVVATALEIAGRIAANGPLGVAACRELVRLAGTDTDAYAQRLDHWRTTVFTSEDAREGATAFMEKRPPVWRGR